MQNEIKRAQIYFIASINKPLKATGEAIKILNYAYLGFFHSVNMATFEETGNAFWKWLQDNGTTLSKDIAIKDYRSEGAGRGVIATNDIKVWISNASFIAKPLTQMPLGGRALILTAKIYSIVAIHHFIEPDRRTKRRLGSIKWLDTTYHHFDVRKSKRRLVLEAILW